MPAWGRGGARKEPETSALPLASWASPQGTGQVHQECGPSPEAGEEERPTLLWAGVPGGRLSSRRACMIWGGAGVKEGGVQWGGEGERKSSKGDKAEEG